MEDFDFKTTTLSSGASIALDPSWKKFDGRPLTVELTRSRDDVSRIDLPFPSAGLGGGRFVVSPSERLVVLSTFSGQSEEGYDVFSVTPDFKRIGGMEYVYGELAAFAFSRDETCLVAGVPMSCSEWSDLWEDAEPDVDPSLRTFEFAHLYAHDLLSHTVSESTVRVSASKSWIPPEKLYEANLRPAFITSTQVRLSMPWRELVVPYPFPEEIVIAAEQ